MSDIGFRNIFGAPPDAVGNAPGRVNLIGEHIDYNGGMVLPMALDVGLTAAIARRTDTSVQIASDRFDGVKKRTIGAPKTGGWADYAMGAIECAFKEGLLSGGADLFITSTIPDGAGLSSSAALIVAILKAARATAASNISDVDIAVLARRVENDYIGMPCGIMDQMAVAVAAPGQAIALNTKTLEYNAIDLPSDYNVVVIHSGIHRKLSDGRYAARKSECDKAAAILGNSELCLLSEDDQKKATDLPTPLHRRVRHCLSEHARVLRAADALRARDVKTFGALMNESHASMRDDFDVSLPEIDALVDDAIKYGAVGARLTGGGFGGCIVAYIETSHAPHLKEQLISRHPNASIVV